MFAVKPLFQNCQYKVCDVPKMSRYLVTNFQIVPRGTEGAVSVEGTFSGLLASILLASIGCLMGEVVLAIYSYYMNNLFCYSGMPFLFNIFTSLA